MIKKIKKIKIYNQGSLLLELLITISLLAILFSVGINVVYLSLRGNKVSGERDVASNLVSESLEATRSVVEENWGNVYNLTKNTQHYYPTNSNGKWIFSLGDESIILNGVSYARYLTISNVSRDSSTRNIESTYINIDDDPSTQKVTATVSWDGGVPVVFSQYFYRWKNKICDQTTWTSGGSGNTVKNCSDTSYDTKDTGIDVSTGSIQTNAISGNLISSVFDTTANSNTIGYNSIMWKGTLGGSGLNEGNVSFQLATSSSPSGPWNFYGGNTCGPLDFFSSSPNTPIELKGNDCFSAWNNKRYFRYQIKLCSNDCISQGSNTPTVDDIIVNWSP